jgi:hypothetical protein
MDSMLAARLDELEANLNKVDTFYAQQVKKIDTFYGERVARLLEETAALRNRVTALETAISQLQRRK